jgi:hypothetical protein
MYQVSVKNPAIITNKAWPLKVLTQSEWLFFFYVKSEEQFFSYMYGISWLEQVTFNDNYDACFVLDLHT